MFSQCCSMAARFLSCCLQRYTLRRVFTILVRTRGLAPFPPKQYPECDCLSGACSTPSAAQRACCFEVKYGLIARSSHRGPPRFNEQSASAGSARALNRGLGMAAAAGTGGGAGAAGVDGGAAHNGPAAHLRHQSPGLRRPKRSACLEHRGSAPEAGASCPPHPPDARTHTNKHTFFSICMLNRIYRRPSGSCVLHSRSSSEPEH